MGPVSKESRGKIIRQGNRRLVVIPDEFFLEGEEIIIMQDRDGAISIHPAEDAARQGMWVRFNPFTVWVDGTWPKVTPVWDDESLSWVEPSDRPSEPDR